jgi:hypothetical protein
MTLKERVARIAKKTCGSHPVSEWRKCVAFLLKEGCTVKRVEDFLNCEKHNPKGGSISRIREDARLNGMTVSGFINWITQ